MDYAALKTLIDSDPANAGRTDEEVLSWCNTPSVTRDQETLASSLIFEICTSDDNVSEWQALSADDRQLVRDILTVYAPEGVPTEAGSSARSRLVAILGTSTKQDIAAAIPETVSPAVDAGLGVVNLGDVQNARAL